MFTLNISFNTTSKNQCNFIVQPFKSIPFLIESYRNIDCEPQTHIKHGVIRGNLHKEGSRLKVECDPGFTPESPTTQCVNGVWTHRLMCWRDGIDGKFEICYRNGTVSCWCQISGLNEKRSFCALMLLSQIKRPPYDFRDLQITGELGNRPGTWRFSPFVPCVVKNSKGAGRRLYMMTFKRSTRHNTVPGRFLHRWITIYTCNDVCQDFFWHHASKETDTLLFV